MALVTAHPCHAYHGTISAVGLIGGWHLPRPGEVSLAHHGVLFLDERPECRRYVLEELRQPLEEVSHKGPTRLSRRYPAEALMPHLPLW
jgi:magnesium chelatase family protein